MKLFYGEACHVFNIIWELLIYLIYLIWDIGNVTTHNNKSSHISKHSDHINIKSRFQGNPEGGFII